MIKKLCLISLSILSTNLWAQSSYISKSQTLAEGGSEFGIISATFMPTKHANSDGDLVEFNESESYFTTDLDFGGKYGFTNNFQLYAGARFRYNQSKQTYEDEELTFSASGAESLFLQLKYSFDMINSTQYSIEANYRNALYTNKSYDASEVPTDIVLGDGGTDVSLGLAASFYTKSQNFLSGRVLYRNPGKDLSSEIFTEAEFAIVWPYFTILAGFESLYSLQGDPYSDEPEEKPQVSTGSTNLYNSINRSYTAPYLGMNFALGESWRVELKAISRLYGVSTDLGNTFLISLQKRKSESKSFAQKDAAFKEYTSEGSVVKVSTKRTAVSVDIGLKDGLEKGMKVDFYHFDYLGGNQLIASGYAVKVGLSKSIVKVTKRFSKIRIEAGSTVVRAGLIR